MKPNVCCLQNTVKQWRKDRLKVKDCKAISSQQLPYKARIVILTSDNINLKLNKVMR